MTTEVAVIETEAVHLNGLDDEALLQFHAGSSLRTDFGNWYVPTIEALHNLCRAAGFAEVRTVVGPPPHPRRQRDCGSNWGAGSGASRRRSRRRRAPTTAPSSTPTREGEASFVDHLWFGTDRTLRGCGVTGLPAIRGHVQKRPGQNHEQADHRPRR